MQRILKRILMFVVLITSLYINVFAEEQEGKLKLAIDGLTHQHVETFFRSNTSAFFELVGIAESDDLVIKKYQQKYGFSDTLIFNNLEELLANVDCDAVAAFNPISEHLETVKLCAPKGVHVMVEKPLAINLKQAKAMQKMASDHHIHLITNYETTWYPALQHVYNEVSTGRIGKLVKLEVNCGHRGPKGINVYPEFLDWLIDPEKNGGGALIDFGCYGVNIATYFNKGKRPLSVTAITASNKPDVYKLVEDEAIILLEYDSMQCIVQGSWNWPFNRKDVEVYGNKGFYHIMDSEQYGYRLKRKDNFRIEQSKLIKKHKENPYAHFSALIKGKIKQLDYEPSALQNNLLVVEILDAALKSSRTGRKINLKQL